MDKNGKLKSIIGYFIIIKKQHRSNGTCMGLQRSKLWIRPPSTENKHILPWIYSTDINKQVNQNVQHRTLEENSTFNCSMTKALGT
jgi:hypothetical protein